MLERFNNLIINNLQSPYPRLGTVPPPNTALLLTAIFELCRFFRHSGEQYGGGVDSNVVNLTIYPMTYRASTVDCKTRNEQVRVHSI